MAVLRFENLEPGNDSDWIGRALSEEVSGQLEGTRHNAVIPFATLHLLDAALGPRPVSSPGVSAERPAAIGAGANRIINGFYTVRGNRLSVTAVQENPETRKGAPPFTVSGAVDDVLHLADEVARNIDEEAAPPITGSARALRSYALALESPPPAAAALMTQAVELDPDFGKPYVAQAQAALANRDIEGFARIFAAVRARGNGVRAVDRAILNLDDARLHADLATRIDAAAALVRLMPADPFRLQELGTAELEANRYAEAADHYRKLQALLPTSAEPLNLLGYAEMYAGDEAGAAKSMEAFRRASPTDPNALDSSGDAAFFFNHFDEAEKWYLQAHGRNPAFADGTELLKAAWARLMRNDRGGAAALLERYRAERGKAHDDAASLRAAQMLRVIGNHDAANRMLLESAASAFPAVVQAANAQLVWWRVLDGTGAAPEQTSENARALIAVAKKDYAAAVPIWRKLAETASPTEWWTRSVYARVLLATGQTQESARYARFTPVPHPTRTLSFDELWYPWLLNSRLPDARHQASGKVE